jgi:magnesium-transporting ATPase (P-type)
LFGGVIIDFAAVVIIAFERPAFDILRKSVANKADVEKRLKSPLKSNLHAGTYGLIWTIITCAAIIFAEYQRFNYSSDDIITAVFISFTFTQIISLVEIMRDKSIFIPNVKLNTIFTLLLVFVAGFMVCGYMIPEAGEIFGIVRLNIEMWVVIAAVPLVMFGVYEVAKVFQQNRS